MRTDREWSLVEEVLKGNRPAFLMVNMIEYVFGVWDDLVDGDKIHTKDTINKAFTLVFCELPRNAFYATWQRELQPLIEASIWSWLAANEFEKGSEELKVRAHVMRCEMLNIVIACARLIGGIDWAIESAAKLRAAIPAETLPEYLKE